LEGSSDSYMNMQNCGALIKDESQLPYVIVNLSDDIVVDSIKLSN